MKDWDVLDFCMVAIFAASAGLSALLTHAGAEWHLVAWGAVGLQALAFFIPTRGR